jgi:hypothetical protein
MRANRSTLPRPLSNQRRRDARTAQCSKRRRLGHDRLQAPGGGTDGVARRRARAEADGLALAPELRHWNRPVPWSSTSAPDRRPRLPRRAPVRFRASTRSLDELERRDPRRAVPRTRADSPGWLWTPKIGWESVGPWPDFDSGHQPTTALLPTRRESPRAGERDPHSLKVGSITACGVARSGREGVRPCASFRPVRGCARPDPRGLRPRQRQNRTPPSVDR